MVSVELTAVEIEIPTTETPPGAVEGTKLTLSTINNLPDPYVLDKARPVQVVLTVDNVTAPADEA